jgi:hypothetical protein
MNRRLVNLLAAGSLVLSAVTWFALVRSWFFTSIASLRHDWVTSVNGDADWKVVTKCSKGAMAVYLFRSELGPPPKYTIVTRNYTSKYQREWEDYPARFDRWPLVSAEYHLQGWMGFQYASAPEDFAPPAWMTRRVIRFPLSAPAVALLLWPLWRVSRFVVAHRRRQLVGYCSACGYDLRATPDRCPECGTAVPAHQTAEASA